MENRVELSRSVLRKISPLIRELDEIILYYLRVLYEGHYTCDHLWDIPGDGTNHMFTLTMNVMLNTRFPGKYIHYKGDVDVMRIDYNFNLKFTTAETQYEFINGDLYGNGTLVFSMGGSFARISIYKN